MRYISFAIPDGTSVHAWTGRYGDYLSAKVAKVFPDLFQQVTSSAD